MKKVLIFGDSHVGSIYSAHKKCKIKSDFDICFLPSPGPVVNYLEFKENSLRLLPPPESWPISSRQTQKTFQEWYDAQKNRFLKESGGSTSINLRLYDSIVIYGGNIFPVTNFKWWELTYLSELYSYGLCSEILEKKINKSIGYKWLNSLSNYIRGGGHVYMVLNPYLNEEGLEGNLESYLDLTTLSQTPDDVDINNLFLIYKNLFLRYGVKFIPPPLELFGLKAVKSQFKSNNPMDFSHLNFSGASLVLKKIVSEIGSSIY